MVNLCLLLYNISNYDNILYQITPIRKSLNERVNFAPKKSFSFPYRRDNINCNFPILVAIFKSENIFPLGIVLISEDDHLNWMAVLNIFWDLFDSVDSVYINFCELAEEVSNFKSWFLGRRLRVYLRDLGKWSQIINVMLLFGLLLLNFSCLLLQFLLFFWRRNHLLLRWIDVWECFMEFCQFDFNLFH